jgi:hypothetical protein
LASRDLPLRSAILFSLVISSSYYFYRDLYMTRIGISR